MIKNDESRVHITTRNVKFYTKKKFECEVGDIISINIEYLPKKSHNKVIAICEICGVEIEIPFSKYNENKNRHGFYSCKKCSYVKRKNTMLEDYGVEYSSQLTKNRERMRTWMGSEEFREKSKSTMLENYGVDSYSKTNTFKEKISQLTKERIAKLKEDSVYDCPFSWETNKELRENGMLKKYGAKHPFHVKEIKEKIQNINLEKYGHISPFGNKEIQDKIKKIFIDKYGVDNPFKNKEIQDKIRKKKEEKWDKIDTKLFKEYRNSVRNHTNRNRKTLFENWDGYDYYDGEYIKDTSNINSNDMKYPTVDHKTSCIYGFKNNISPKEISEMSNLCITKRIINCKKSHLNEGEFLILLLD